MRTCGEASCRRHPQSYIRVLVHSNDGRLSVFGWPLHHCIIFPAAQEEGHANIVWVGTVFSTGVNIDAEWVALRVVEAIAFHRGAKRGGGENVGELMDLPDSTGANGLSKSDVIDQDGPRGDGWSSNALEEITELLCHLQIHVRYFPGSISITWKTKSREFILNWLGFICTRIKSIITTQFTRSKVFQHCIDRKAFPFQKIRKRQLLCCLVNINKIPVMVWILLSFCTVPVPSSVLIHITSLSPATPLIL